MLAKITQSLADAPVAKSLFGNVRWTWIWLIVRFVVGYERLTAGWEKLHDPT